MPPRDEKEYGMLFINDATSEYMPMPLGAIRELYIAEMDEHFTPRRGPDDGFIKPGTDIKDDGFIKPGTEEKAEFTVILPRMSRKRFIKMMMSLGYSRNFARDIAEYCWRKQIPYRTTYIKTSILMMYGVKN